MRMLAHHPRPASDRVYITVSGGRINAFRVNTHRITIAENTPNERNGTSGDSAVAQNAPAVVSDVTKIACSARFIVCLIRCGNVAGSPAL
eukprot:29015-Pelagococcus_subviridis.AAC.6